LYVCIYRTKQTNKEVEGRERKDTGIGTNEIKERRRKTAKMGELNRKEKEGEE
jgi:hypothetical protein